MTRLSTITVIGAGLLLASAATGSVAQADDDVLIMGGADKDVFLGCLTCAEADPSSVWNRSSTYGWANEYGKWSRFGPYASPYSNSSACNPYSSNGPVLVDRRGNEYGRLSVNQYQSSAVCSSNGSPKICRALRIMCATD